MLFTFACVLGEIFQQIKLTVAAQTQATRMLRVLAKVTPQGWG